MAFFLHLLLVISCMCEAATSSESCSNYYIGKLILAVGDSITMGITSDNVEHPYAMFLEKHLPQVKIELIGGAYDNSREIHDELQEKFSGWPLFTTLPSVVIILAGGQDTSADGAMRAHPEKNLRMLESMHFMCHRFAASKRVDIKTIAVTIPTPISSPIIDFVNTGLRKFTTQDRIKQHGRIYGIKEITSLVDLDNPVVPLAATTAAASPTMTTPLTFSVQTGAPNPLWTPDFAYLSTAGHDALGQRILDELCRLALTD